MRKYVQYIIITRWEEGRSSGWTKVVKEKEKENVKQVTGHIKLGFYIVQVCECERRKVKVISIYKSVY